MRARGMKQAEGGSGRHDSGVQQTRQGHGGSVNWAQSVWDVQPAGASPVDLRVETQVLWLVPCAYSFMTMTLQERDEIGPLVAHIDPLAAPRIGRRPKLVPGESDVMACCGKHAPTSGCLGTSQKLLGHDAQCVMRRANARARAAPPYTPQPTTSRRRAMCAPSATPMPHAARQALEAVGAQRGMCASMHVDPTHRRTGTGGMSVKQGEWCGCMPLAPSPPLQDALSQCISSGTGVP
ncbi:hypothetical protein JB92DRAFT_3127548 [Gautieria morchelliformis]|nr:hypothetical protein JB92DRAFT_3127548 [Gautieria morchelliformis]